MPSNDEKPPFDLVRASFYLVAGVFAVYSAVIIFGVIVCGLYVTQILEKTPVGSSLECIKEGRLYEALGTMLASALAFAAGRSTK